MLVRIFAPVGWLAAVFEKDNVLNVIYDLVDLVRVDPGIG
jgi:hypothetical protein